MILLKNDFLAFGIKPSFLLGVLASPHIGPFDQGTDLLDGGDYNSAIHYLKEAIRIKPDYAPAHNNLGNAHYRLGQYQDDIASYKEALRIKPDHINSHNNLGVAYEQLGLDTPTEDDGY